MDNQEATIRMKFGNLTGVLDERSRRYWAATEAISLGYGGVSIVSRATQISRNAIQRGINELKNNTPPSGERLRKKGGGRKLATEIQPGVLESLEKLLEPITSGNPCSAIRWTSKSIEKLATELRKNNYIVSNWLVHKYLHQLGYSLQSNKKDIEGNSQHVDRNSQFELINSSVELFIKNGQPVISVDTKKKEILGNYANNGKDWNIKNQPKKVNAHDFPTPDIDRAIPYGVYDVNKNLGFVNVGVDHDTASFAVASIREWWRQIGNKMYPNVNSILITADGGGSNGSRIHLWKWELQKFVDEIKIPVTVAHFPPGTSKWNKIEHKLFSFISINWKGKPLIDYETVINLISNTVTVTGLSVKCLLDKNFYPIGNKLTKKQIKTINILRNDFHGEWNYTINPRNT
jgi:hypothetical protein